MVNAACDKDERKHWFLVFSFGGSLLLADYE